MANLDPIFEDGFFDIRIEDKGKADILQDCNLRIEVYDWDQYTSHDPLGQVSSY